MPRVSERGQLWGPETAKAVQNFPISGETVPLAVVRWLARLKGAAAGVNAELGLLPKRKAGRVERAAAEIVAGKHDDQFPIDIFQTGPGTSSNMNANEVIARLASERLGSKVHPNDHVNRGQSSNDVIPTAIHVSGVLQATEDLLPALEHLAETIAGRAEELKGVVKTGRTHLMDAMPLTLGQELSGWEAQVRHG